jgi:transposase
MWMHLPSSRLRRRTAHRTSNLTTEVGSSRLRKALYFPAMAALRFNPALAALRQRLQAAGKPGKLIVGAAMRKLLAIAFGVLRSGKPFDPHHGLNLNRKNDLNQASAA